jgi:hypothetical protein
MPKLGQCILLGADIEVIYEVLMDVKQLPDWFVNIDNIEVTDNFPQVGGSANIIFKHNDMLLNYKMTTTEFVEGEYGVFALDGDLVGIQRWTTIPERGGYRLSIDYDYDVTTEGLHHIAEKLIRDTLTKSLENLKSIVETQTVHPYF